MSTDTGTDNVDVRSTPHSSSPSARTVLVVAGLAFEAKAVREAEGVQVLHGLGASALAASISAAAAHAIGIVSFGTAGALSPDLRPGDCVLGKAVLEYSGTARTGAALLRYDTDARWLRQLAVSLPAARGVDFFAAAEPVVNAADKAALWADTGAAAVDMESGHLARLAGRLGLPFAVCRVIIDRADHTLPHAAMAGMGSDGETKIWPVLASLARGPRQLPSLLRLAGDARTARRALSEIARNLPPGFGFSPVN